ncbi:MAG: glycerol-3-phosphate acyltransferase [Dehalococcoidales bacterium]
MWSDAVLILASYLLGTAPQLALLARVRRVQLQGDFHESLWNKAGKALAVTGILGEFIKGIIPVLVGRWLGFSPVTVVIAGLAAVCGQMWPVFARFDGEKGNSIAIAMVTALNFKPAIVALVLPLVALVIRTLPRLKAKSAGEGKALVGGTYSRSFPLGMALYFLAQPFLSCWFNRPPEIIWGTALLFVLIMIRRLTAGLERDLKASRDIKSILLNRLLYDRAAAPWRQGTQDQE